MDNQKSFPEPVWLGGVWKEGDILSGCGLRIRVGRSDEKGDLIVEGGNGRIVGRLWENDLFKQAKKGPRFSGSLGEARAKLWMNTRKTKDNQPDYRLAVETDMKRQAERGGATQPAAAASDDGFGNLPY